MSVQMSLAVYFRSQARWREEVALSYPDDLRNEAAAAALEEIADYVTNLTDDDPRIEAVSAYASIFGLDCVESGGLEGGVAISPAPASRIGFGPRDGVDRELTWYVEANLAEQIHQEQIHQGLDQGTEGAHGLEALRQVQVQFLQAVAARQR